MLGCAHPVGYPRHLLLESAVAWAAPGRGNCVCVLRDLGHLDIVPPTANVRDVYSSLSRRGSVVALHLPLA